MNSGSQISSTFNEVWGKLNARWKDEASEAFYQQYVLKMSETIEEFERACSDLNVGAAALSKKLQAIEQNIDYK